MLDLNNFLRKTDRGEDTEKKYRPYRKGRARQLNEAQFGKGTLTDCYLNRKPIEAVGRITQLLEVVASWRALLGG